MNNNPATPPTPRFTVVPLGVSEIRARIACCEALCVERRCRATGEAVAFFDTGGTVIGRFPWDRLAQDVTLPDQPRTKTFRGMTLAWNCGSVGEVDEVLDFAVSKGASLLKPAHETGYGGYSGYFGDPDNRPWEVVVAPGIEVGEDRRVHLPD